MRVKDNKTKPSLSGTIPMEICVLDELEILDLRNNQIYGEVPEVPVESLNNFRQLLLTNNEITGSISPVICKLINIMGRLASLQPIAAAQVLRWIALVAPTAMVWIRLNMKF